MYKLFLTAAVFMLTLATISAPAFADVPTQSISLSPATQQVSVDPGSTISASIDVINSGGDNFTASLSILPYYVTGNNYDPHFSQLPGTVDASKWVSLETNTVAVDSLKLKTVHYMVSVPKNTTPGGYYAVIFAQTNNEASSGGVISHNRIGDILYITVNGPVKESGTLTGDRLDLFHLSTSATIGVKITNTGGVHFNSTTLMTITNISKTKTLFKGSYDRIILPQTVREVSATWNSPTPIGIYEVHRQADILGKEQTLPVSYIILISPWFLFGVVSLILILLAFIGQAWRHRLRKNRRKN